MRRTGHSRSCRISRWPIGSPPRSTWRGRRCAKPSASSRRVSRPGRPAQVGEIAAHGSAPWPCTGCAACSTWRAATRRARSRSSSASCRRENAGHLYARECCGQHVVRHRRAQAAARPTRRRQCGLRARRRTCARAPDGAAGTRGLRVVQPDRAAARLTSAARSPVVLRPGSMRPCFRPPGWSSLVRTPRPRASSTKPWPAHRQATRGGCFQSSRCCRSRRTPISGPARSRASETARPDSSGRLHSSAGRISLGPPDGGHYVQMEIALIAVWNTKETRHLVTNEVDPEPRDKDRENDPGQEAEATRQASGSRQWVAHDWHREEDG